MALAVAAKTSRRTLRDKELVLTLTPTGNYVAGGDTVNLTSISNPNFKSDAGIGFPGLIEQYEVLSCPAGYVATLIPGASLSTWLLKINETGAALNGALAELAAGAYPAAILASNFSIRLIGPKLRF